MVNLIRRTKEAVKEFDNIRYRRMKKVLMGHEEQNTNQSNELPILDNDNSINIQNEILVRNLFSLKFSVQIIVD